jgi:protein-tyrosine phosphatase
MRSWRVGFVLMVLFFLSPVALGKKHATTAPGAGVEQIPSEDSVINDFHSLGLINGHVNIFRSACPVRDLAKGITTTQPSAAESAEARQRMQRLYDLGIRTVISFQNPAAKDEEHPNEVVLAVAMEKEAAAEVGLNYIAMPISNNGKDSLQDMSDQAVLDWLSTASATIFSAADKGGVDFHCTAGHDRTGIVAAYMRIKFEHWPVEQAIAEMRRLGHNWVKFSSDGGVSSWHEDHLRAIAKMLN